MYGVCFHSVFCSLAVSSGLGVAQDSHHGWATLLVLRHLPSLRHLEQSFTVLRFRAGETAHSVMCLLDKHEGLNLIPEPTSKARTDAMICNPNKHHGSRQADPKCSMSSQLNK